ncbi:MAG TPA: hypothetical protein VLD67_17920 [Vicinamibacterales bacterium]|nr:hypothetical protein [Vicinamibacterales bacterium]
MKASQPCAIELETEKNPDRHADIFDDVPCLDCWAETWSAPSFRTIACSMSSGRGTHANRADVFFPVDAAGKVYTILDQEFLPHTDNFQQRLQLTIATGRSGFSAANPAPIDVVVGESVVRRFQPRAGPGSSRISAGRAEAAVGVRP